MSSIKLTACLNKNQYSSEVQSFCTNPEFLYIYHNVQAKTQNDLTYEDTGKHDPKSRELGITHKMTLDVRISNHFEAVIISMHMNIKENLIMINKKINILRREIETKKPQI